VSFSPQLRRKLQETLGADGAEELVSSMDRLEASRGDIAELTQAMLAMDANSKQAMLAMELRLTEKLAGLDSKIEQKHAGLLKWSFLFWVGAVAAIAGLAGVLRR
jgi:hypothetical protein